MNKTPVMDGALREALEARLGIRREDDEALIARVRQRVSAAIRAQAPGPPAHHTVRAADAGWQEVAPGVARKMLWTAPGAESCLLRLAPGASVPAHAHPADEECVVLEGSLCIGELVLQAGDFHVAPGGSSHAATTTATGAVVYLRGAPDWD